MKIAASRGEYVDAVVAGIEWWYKEDDEGGRKK